MKIIDVNTSWGFWPIQKFPHDTIADLDSQLGRAGIEEAWVSATESVLYPEPDTYDRRLFRKIAEFPRLRGVKTVNPILANWQSQCRRLLESNSPPAALKIFPNYHGYHLDDSDEVARYAAAQGLPILVQMRLNDERNQPTFLQVNGVKPQEMAAFSKRHPDTAFIALCPYLGELPVLSEGSGNLYADISFLDGGDVLQQSAEILGRERLMFGSHAPFLYPESAILKIKHSSLSHPEDICSHNVESLLIERPHVHS